MEIKSFWPDRLKYAVKIYNRPHRSKKDRMENRNDFYDLDQLTKEDCNLLLQVWDGMDKVYEDPAGLISIDEYQIWYKDPNRERISDNLHLEEPYKSFQAKYPHLYKTMIIWVWG